MQRLISFDIAKAICIILVVIGHYVPGYSPQWYVGVHDVIVSGSAFIPCIIQKKQ